MERNLVLVGNDNASGKSHFPDEGGAARFALPLHGEELVETKKLMRLFEAHLSGTRCQSSSSMKIALGCINIFLRYTKKPPWKWLKQDVSNFIHAKKIECDLSVSRQAQYFTYLRMFQAYLHGDLALCNDIHQRFGIQPQVFIGPDNAIPIKRRNKVRKRIVTGLIEEEYGQLIAEFDAAIRLAYEAGSKSFHPLRRDKVMVHLTYLLGLRVSELTSLTLANFMRDPEYPDFGPYALWTVIGKGSKLRVIRAINPEIKDLIDWYLQAVRPRFLSERVEDDTLLFFSERGGKLCNEQFRRTLQKMGAQAGIKKKLAPHMLRHTNGTDMVYLLGAEGARQQMGHEHLSTTLGTYYHEDPKLVGDRIRKAVGGITAALNSIQTENDT